MPLFARFVRGFVGFLRCLSFYRCLAVAGFAFVVCGGFLRFGRLFLTAVCFFFANFSSLLMSVFIFFLSLSVVSWRFAFLHFRIKNWIFSRLDVLFFFQHFCFKSVLFVLFAEFCEA